MSVKPVAERRKDQRVDNNIPVKICRDGGDIVTETMNVSRWGAYCCVNQSIAPMTRLKIHLLLSSGDGGKTRTKKISCGGVVVRCEPAAEDKRFNVAIFFSDVTSRDAHSLTDYVNRFMSERNPV